MRRCAGSSGGNAAAPGIVPVIDVGSDDDRAFVVSAFIEGSDLSDVIEKNRPSPREAARIVADIAEALHFAHREGFGYRDIKPENVLLDGDRRPLLTDFGLAASFEEVVRRKGLRSGTLMYMSPEAVAGEAAVYFRKERHLLARRRVLRVADRAAPVSGSHTGCLTGAGTFPSAHLASVTEPERA